MSESPVYRILIATHALLAPQYGAAQLAINLAQALKEDGHAAVLWSPSVPQGTAWWRVRSVMRRQLDRFITENGPFDLVDAPPLLLAPAASRGTVAVARNVQPPVQYLVAELFGSKVRNPRDALRWVLGAATTLSQLPVVLGDWMRAQHILALGELDYAWMKRWMPFLAHKLSVYRPALAAEERRILAGIRARRSRWAGPGVRFLWIGRWAAHKGTRRLADFLRTRRVAAPYDKVTIAGCGKLPDGAIASELLRTERVRVVPSYAREELYGLLKSHDAGLFTSDVEGWGLSLNEMIEAGLPVFATRAGGVPDLERSCPGCLLPFPPPVAIDVNALRSKMHVGASYDELMNLKPVGELYKKLIGAAKGAA